MTKHIEEMHKYIDSTVHAYCDYNVYSELKDLLSAVEEENSKALTNLYDKAYNEGLENGTRIGVIGSETGDLKATDHIIKIHTDAIKELEGRKKPVSQPDLEVNDADELHNESYNQALDEAITYHREEIKRLTK